MDSEERSKLLFGLINRYAWELRRGGMRVVYTKDVQTIVEAYAQSIEPLAGLFARERAAYATQLYQIDEILGSDRDPCLPTVEAVRTLKQEADDMRHKLDAIQKTIED